MGLDDAEYRQRASAAGKASILLWLVGGYISWLATLVLKCQQRRPQQVLVAFSGGTWRVNSTPQPHLTRTL
jgi:hypothetical protein